MPLSGLTEPQPLRVSACRSSATTLQRGVTAVRIPEASVSTNSIAPDAGTLCESAASWPGSSRPGGLPLRRRRRSGGGEARASNHASADRWANFSRASPPIRVKPPPQGVAHDTPDALGGGEIVENQHDIGCTRDIGAANLPLVAQGSAAAAMTWRRARPPGAVRRAAVAP